MSRFDARLKKVKEQLNIGQTRVRLTILGDMELNGYLSKGYFKDETERQAYEAWVIKRKQEEDDDFNSPYVRIEFDEAFFVKDIDEFRRLNTDNYEPNQIETRKN